MHVSRRVALRRVVPLIAAGAVLIPTALRAQRAPARRPPAPTRVTVPTPRSVLGFEPGDDRKLTDWPTLLRYYRALADASDRVTYRELGKTTLGVPLVALVISSPRNLRNLEQLRALNAGLADPRTLGSNRAALDAIRNGRTIALITAGIHSDEVGCSLTPAILAYRLATDTSAATRAILDSVVTLLVPSLNPDGVSIVTRWYNRTLGTPAEGADPPELYHHYAGHDNNRDWYAFTQVETQLVVDSLHNVWHPQIVHDIHQMSSTGARLFVPPYTDPIEPNVDPLLVSGVNALGSAVAWELAAQGKTGITIASSFDAWTPARAYSHYHGGVRILSETASADLASPVNLPFDRLVEGARGPDPRRRTWNFTAPWLGGRWALRDIVGYQTAAAYAVLRHAASERSQWLESFLSVAWRGVRGWRDWPYAYVIPKQGQDSVALGTLLGILRRGQVELRTAQQAFTAAGQRFAAGSYVVVLRQPYAAFAKTLLEVQRYPDRRLYPEGPPERPYDVTAHTLPLLLGVTAVEVRDSLRVPLSAPATPPRATPRAASAGREEAPRIGVYRSYDVTEDEGWTRWVLDTWKVPFVSLVDSAVRAGRLKDKLDVIVLPDQPPRDLLEGLPSRYPAPYAGGIGEAGAQALDQFVTDGGTLVALNAASRFVVQALLLPVRNVLEGVPDDEFFAPGSIFRIELDDTHPLAGRRDAGVAWFESGPAFDVLDSTTVRVVARYPSEPARVLLSGWVLHPERVAGRAALVEVRHGAGRVILFGFRPQYRGQSQATFPLLFNALQLR
ncbi:MAG: M14 family zinc carboxypeptidase [Gemmatimonadales bacterium]